MWQLPMQVGNIGNSYVFRTAGGKVIVFDGGWPAEQLYLRGFIAALGNEVEAWFISHPHDDHMGVLWQILKDRQGMKINHIYHSRFSPELIELEKPYNEYAKDFYSVLDTVSIPVTDFREAGYVGEIDGFNFKILGVVNEEFHTNPFNNSSMVIKVWDDRKSILFFLQIRERNPARNYSMAHIGMIWHAIICRWHIMANTAVQRISISR